MPVLAVVALMGVLFLPGSATAPVYAQTSTATPSVGAAGEDEPSKRLATADVVAPTYTVSMTAYNAVPGQTDGDPMTTASGMRSNPQIIAARSRDLADELPFGTVIKIERTAADTPGCRYGDVAPLIGYRVIGDTMDSRWTKKIDVLLDSRDTVAVDGRQVNPGIALGVCSNVKITVVGHIDPARPPATQEELIKMFSSPSLAMR